jgi:hypothetical protein
MIIQRLFSEKEKPGKKEKIAKGISISSGIGALGSAGKAIYHDTISKNATIDEQKRAEKLAKKTGTKVAGYFNDKLEGDPGKVKKAEELAKRHDRYVKSLINRHEAKFKDAGKAGIGLAVISTGSGLYALKKKKNSKKDE